MRRFLYLLRLLIMPGMLIFPLRVMADGVPVAPLHPEELENGETVFRLQNDYFLMEIHPESGGVRSLRPKEGDELLAGSIQTLPFPEPVLAQARPQIDGETPPLWQARAWVTSEAHQVVMLSQTFSDPANIRITQIITLLNDRPEISWSTRITAVAPPALPPEPFTTVPLSLPDPENAPSAFWFPSQTGETPTCGEWLQAPSLPESRITGTLVVQFPQHLLFLQQDWRMEDGAVLDPVLTTQSAAPEAHAALRWSATLPDDLPPQGWTALHDLRLRMQPIEPVVNADDAGADAADDTEADAVVGIETICDLLTP